MGAELLSGGLELLGQGLNAFTQGMQNRANQRRAEKMFQWEVNANRENWRMQNEYNLPINQMERLKAAGLNPNLVYGNGATTSAGSISGASGNAPQGEAPRFQPSDIIGKYMSTKLQQASLDQTAEATALLQREQALKQAQTIGENARTVLTGLNSKHSQFDFDQKSRLADTVVKQAIANLENTETNTQQAINTGVRNDILAANTVQQGIQNILESKKRVSKSNAEINQINALIENVRKDGKLKDLDINLKKNGLQPTDALWQRSIIQYLEQHGIQLQQNLKEGLNQFLPDLESPTNWFNIRKKAGLPY